MPRTLSGTGGAYVVLMAQSRDVSTYHRISEALKGEVGFHKSAAQILMRLSDIREGVTDDPTDDGENTLVEWGLHKLVDFINSEQWGLADDLILGFPRTMRASNRKLLDKLIELRQQFEDSEPREIIVDDLTRKRGGGVILDEYGDDELLKHSI